MGCHCEPPKLFKKGRCHLDNISLPTDVVIEISELDCCLNDEEEIGDAVVEFLADNFGFCIRGCEISLEDEGIAKVSNIEWDTSE